MPSKHNFFDEIQLHACHLVGRIRGLPEIHAERRSHKWKDEESLTGAGCRPVRRKFPQKAVVTGTGCELESVAARQPILKNWI
jgi:hypothetical protein